MTRLVKHRFTPEDVHLPEVQDFYCGDDRWDIEVAQWIKAGSVENSVLVDMFNFETEVWLWRLPEGELVGFSSLGEQLYTWPLKSRKKELVNILPFIGVHKKFHGKPDDAERDDKFAYQILDDLIEYAATKTNRFPLIMLSVEQENKRAIHFYENRNFVDLGIPRNAGNGIVYRRMMLNLIELVTPPPPPDLSKNE